MRGNLINLIDNRYGKLTVLSKGRLGNGGRWYWVCECECGNTKEIMGQHLRNGDLQDCGCETHQRRSESHKKHGPKKPRVRTSEYQAWSAIKTRCGNPRCKAYVNYGGRGIKICERWRSSFKAFLGDMGRKPQIKFTIERTDTNGHYSCGNHSECPDCRANGWKANCVWATYTEQARNRRNTLFVSFRGETRPLSEWAEIVGIDYRILIQRVNKFGWPIDRALTESVKHKRKGKHAVSA